MGQDQKDQPFHRSLSITTLPGDKIVELIDVYKWYDNFHALKGIHLQVKKGERIVICGPSGSGKSTMIRCINRLEEHQTGKILVDGIELTDNLKNIAEIRREIGMVFQQFNLFPHLTVMENCMDGGEIIEQNEPQRFFTSPQHERTKLFLSQILSH